MELFDKRFSYVDSPTEIEAHIIAVQEARRIGMNDEELADYLRVDWISEEEYIRLLRTLGVRRRIVSSIRSSRSVCDFPRHIPGI